MEAWPAGVGREILAETDSSNAEALRRATAGVSGPVWLMARRQTAARGRRGRGWATLDGNLAATLLMRPPGVLAERSFVAALGLFDAMVAATGRPALFGLKWPNDVLLGGGKVAGILLESAGNGALAIGIGVNLAAAPKPEALEPGAVTPVSLAAATGIVVPPEEFLDLLAPAVHSWETVLRQRGFGPVRDAWLSRAARIGDEMTARLPDRTVTGRFETVDDTGALVLATAQGRVVLPAGDVFFGGPVDAAGG